MKISLRKIKEVLGRGQNRGRDILRCVPLRARRRKVIHLQRVPKLETQGDFIWRTSAIARTPQGVQAVAVDFESYAPWGNPKKEPRLYQISLRLGKNLRTEEVVSLPGGEPTEILQGSIANMGLNLSSGKYFLGVGKLRRGESGTWIPANIEPTKKQIEIFNRVLIGLLPQISPSIRGKSAKKRTPTREEAEYEQIISLAKERFGIN